MKDVVEEEIEEDMGEEEVEEEEGEEKSGRMGKKWGLGGVEKSVFRSEGRCIYLNPPQKKPLETRKTDRYTIRRGNNQKMVRAVVGGNEQD